MYAFHQVRRVLPVAFVFVFNYFLGSTDKKYIFAAGGPGADSF